MKNLLIASTLVFLSTNSFATKVDHFRKGFVEIHTSEIQDSVSLEDADQGWNNKSNVAAYGSFGYDFEVLEHTLKTNAYINHSESTMYESFSSRMDTIIHPSVIVTRNILKFEEVQTGDRSRTQALLNQFEWAWGDEEIRIFVGRMWINFGEGQFINPVNPFRASNVFSNYLGIEQAVDGGRWEIARDKDFKLHIYIFGDKRFNDFEERLARTAMIRGEWKQSEHTTINYILGEDLERQKYGAEIAHKRETWKIYGQLMRYTQRIDLEQNESQNLGHFIAGTKFDLPAGFNLEIETGKLQSDRLLASNNELSLSYLPMEDFVYTKLSRYIPDEKYKASLAYAKDQVTGFSFTQLNVDWNFYKNMYLRYFFSSSGESPEDPSVSTAQRDFPESINGIGLRALF